MANDSADVTSSGRSFQVCRPVTAKTPDYIVPVILSKVALFP